MFLQRVKRGKVVAAFDPRSAGTHAKASGVADLSTQLSLGTSITFLCVTPCRSFCYREDHSPVSVLTQHCFQNHFSIMLSC